MEENQNTPEQSKSMMQEASEKLNELKEKGLHFADIAKEKTQELWDEVKSGKLKDEASAKLSELAEKGGKELDELKEKAGLVWLGLAWSEPTCDPPCFSNRSCADSRSQVAAE